MIIEPYTLKANFQELIKKDFNNVIWQEMFSKMKTFQGERKAVGRGGYADGVEVCRKCWPSPGIRPAKAWLTETHVYLQQTAKLKTNTQKSAVREWKYGGTLQESCR